MCSIKEISFLPKFCKFEENKPLIGQGNKVTFPVEQAPPVFRAGARLQGLSRGAPVRFDYSKPDKSLEVETEQKMAKYTPT